MRNLVHGFATSGISQATCKKIRKAVSVLNYFTEEKSILQQNGKIVTGRVSFITLTLPSSQQHSDQFLTSNALKGFLDLCRKRGILANYVWRAEKQKKGNIHYHIITDEIVNYNTIYTLWNLQMERFGYLQRYTQKFAAMTLFNYCFSQENKNTKREVLERRYRKGVAQEWKRPNNTDVKYISDLQGVEKYLSKYLSKNANSDNIVKGRCWSRSQSVSNAVAAYYNDHEFNETAFNLAKDVLKKEVVSFDFFQMVMITVNSLKAWYPWLFDEIRKKVLPFQNPPEHSLQLSL